MFVIAGATGHTGRIIVERLLAAGEKVRALGRNRAGLEPLARQGAEAYVCDVTDAAALAKACSGADGVYALIPPAPQAPDFRSYQERVSDSFESALRQSSVKHAVLLSSLGADKTEKTGPIVGLHNFEEKLNRIPSLHVLHLRPAYFLENMLPQVGVIQKFGQMAGPVKADLKYPMIATRDIGVYAAGALVRRDFSGKQTQELLGAEDGSYSQAAAVIGPAIGKPGLAYAQLPNEMVRGAFLGMGMSASLADLILEMAEAMNTGHCRPLEPRSGKNTTPTTLQQFVADVFVPAYRAKAASA